MASTSAVPSGYFLSVTLDHAALVTAGNSLASGNDVRVAKWNGSAWTELNRVLDRDSSWNSAGTKIWFRASGVCRKYWFDDDLCWVLSRSGIHDAFGSYSTPVVYTAVPTF